MKDYQTINKDKAYSLVVAGKTVKAIDFDDEILYEVNDMMMSEFSDLYQKRNVIFVVKGKYFEQEEENI